MEACVTQVCPNQVRAVQVGPMQISFRQDRLVEHGRVQVGPMQIGACEVRLNETGPVEVRLVQVRTAQVGPR